MEYSESPLSKEAGGSCASPNASGLPLPERVVRVGGAALPLQLALQPALLADS